MNARTADGLLPVDLAQEMDIPSQEIDELAGAVYLGLVGVLALAQHRGAIHVRAVLGSDEVCGFQKNGRPVLPAQGCPAFFCLQGGIDGLPYMAFIAFMKIS